MSSFGNQYKGRRVLVTGHTGFKGSWLTMWLLRLGAQVHGLALDPQPHQTLYDSLGLSDQLVSDSRVDVRDHAKVREVIAQVNPEIVLHLAAQPLVRQSFNDPIETFTTNVNGTLNVLDAIRTVDQSCSVVIVTTDKCYENREWLHSYREEDAMGGHDPYSASKGCAELITSCYRRSFFSSSDAPRVASARAGNVIGGGDWSADRIVPDLIRAIAKGSSVQVRNRHATRPWQHVLEPISGYLSLATMLQSPDALGDSGIGRGVADYCTAFNFGPALTSNRTVADLVAAMLKHTGGDWEDRSDPNAPHEASRLNLAIDRSFHLLDWQPVWDFDRTTEATANWYKKMNFDPQPSPLNAIATTEEQITAYESDARDAGLKWATQSA